MSTARRKKVMYLLSLVDESKEFNTLADHWDGSRSELVVVLLLSDPDSPVQRHIRSRGHACVTIPYAGKKNAWSCLRALLRLMRTMRPDVVNTNLLDASLLGLLAARLTGVPLAVHTRHHTLHNHKYHPFIGVLYDRVCNALAHRIMAVSRVAQEVLVEQEGVRPDKVVVVHHGFDLSAPHRPHPERLALLRARYGLDRPGMGPVIGIIARPFEWKGLDHAIAAFAALLQEQPEAYLMLFNWQGSGQLERYQRQLDALPRKNWRTVVFEPLVDELFHAFDVFVHVPEDQRSEAFGFVYTEALVSGAPSVLTASGIMAELDPRQLQGVHLVPFKDSATILEGLRHWLRERPDAAQRAGFAEANVHYLRPLLSIERKMEALEALYGIPR